MKHCGGREGAHKAYMYWLVGSAAVYTYTGYINVQVHVSVVSQLRVEIDWAFSMTDHDLLYTHACIVYMA